MNRYTIFCTEEQTRKALNLDAPFTLQTSVGKGRVYCRYKHYHTYKIVSIPTAEQMIGWLENKQKEYMKLVVNENEVMYYITTRTELEEKFKLAIRKQEIKIFELKQEFEKL